MDCVALDAISQAIGSSIHANLAVGRPYGSFHFEIYEVSDMCVESVPRMAGAQFLSYKPSVHQSAFHSARMPL